MTEHRVTTHVHGREPAVRLIDIPVTAGMSVRGFVLADDRSWCMVLEPVTTEEDSTNER